MVLRMLVTRCSHYLRHAPRVTGPTTTVCRLCSVLVQSENLGSMALCRYHNLTFYGTVCWGRKHLHQPGSRLCKERRRKEG
ncbi:hypothetical protein NP493_346g02011 [Ridgeia piscesae]|uniref:Uncharacterized protein n=1 Tax=Ridgeia piscesae TaxID=27915 RepID=A0AAD9L4P5_RIDPI|nr:hypothetical protein NP493_346g02011 [Ridgeia piscesae]